MNYQKIYNRIIERAKVRTLAGYKERHHIKPRCIGGTDESFNLVDLTPEEHYVCHQLLVKMHPNNIKLAYACWAMSMCGGKKVTNKIYSWLRKKIFEEQVTLTCRFCKSGFLVHNCNALRRSYCSRECKSKDNRITKICPTCNDIFTRVKSKETTYCSFNCAKINLKPPSQKGKTYGEKITKNCKTCNKPFTRLKCLNLVYCSSKCSFSTRAERLTHKCVNCSIEFTDYKSRGIRKFCSSSCKYSYKQIKEVLL